MKPWCGAPVSIFSAEIVELMLCGGRMHPSAQCKLASICENVLDLILGLFRAKPPLLFEAVRKDHLFLMAADLYVLTTCVLPASVGNAIAVAASACLVIVFVCSLFWGGLGGRLERCLQFPSIFRDAACPCAWGMFSVLSLCLQHRSSIAVSMRSLSPFLSSPLLSSLNCCFMWGFAGSGCETRLAVSRS